MTIEIKVPQLPESVSDAIIALWVKKVGEQVNAEENLLELETDKVVLEVTAPVSGVLTKIVAEQGATVLAGDVIGCLDESINEKATTSSTPKASPSVRKTMAENNITESQIVGSGKHGRILKTDVDNYVNANSKSINSRSSTKSISGQNDSDAIDSTSISDRPERRVPMTRLRARIAERLLDAQKNAAILSTFNEVDLSEVTRLRKKYQERFQKHHGIKLGFMSFFIKAVTEALKRFPEVNARIEDGDIVYQGYYDIGVAVSSERGLVVPIIRNTQNMGNADVEKAIADFATRARAGKLELDELIGGTFSITNGGIFGSMLSTPILNPPQSAILGMHKIEQRPVAVNGEVVIRPMMYLALSYDHRLIDGQAAVSFLVKVKELLEDPASLFLEL
ncbi:MAG TPA: 2-oxoglutarate dehydrogenase complex dihydrolipoyllysine-residue succinyltransferase [Leucothrix mucor]|nr:2-oxoglutarate dehydrogenase complex dihydrolipoyllysine-residue succinyltransferase [Leucothrix mucor]